MKEEKFYVLSHGWANKYYWFDIGNEFSPGERDFENTVKKGELVFSKQSGTTPADVHGSTLAMGFFSQRLVDLLKRNKIINFSVYPIKFVQELRHIGKYYFLDCRDQLPVEKPKTVKEEAALILSRGYSATFYLKDWKSQDIFSLRNSRMIIVTEKVKKLIEKGKLKNVEFKEIKPVVRE